MTFSIWHGLVAVVAGLLVAWIAFLVWIAARRPDDVTLTAALRLLPDTLRLVRRLAVDKSLPRSARIPVWLLLGYLACPIDLVPDFIPGIGYADDAILSGVVLRHLLHRAGSDKLTEHWPGTPEGLAALRRALRLPAPNAARA